MSDLDSLFAGMAQSPLNTQAGFFEPGLYTAEVISLKYQDGFKGKSFIAKFKVLEANNNVSPGETRSWVVKLDKAKTKAAAMADIKALFFALTGRDPRQVKAPEVDPKSHEEAAFLFKAAIDEAYAKQHNIAPDEFIGAKVKVEVQLVKTAPSSDRPQGGEFSRHTWSPSD